MNNKEKYWLVKVSALPVQGLGKALGGGLQGLDASSGAAAAAGMGGAGMAARRAGGALGSLIGGGNQGGVPPLKEGEQLEALSPQHGKPLGKGLDGLVFDEDDGAIPVGPEVFNAPFEATSPIVRDHSGSVGAGVGADVGRADPRGGGAGGSVGAGVGGAAGLVPSPPSTDPNVLPEGQHLELMKPGPGGELMSRDQRMNSFDFDPSNFDDPANPQPMGSGGPAPGIAAPAGDQKGRIEEPVKTLPAKK